MNGGPVGSPGHAVPPGNPIRIGIDGKGDRRIEIPEVILSGRTRLIGHRFIDRSQPVRSVRPDPFEAHPGQPHAQHDFVGRNPLETEGRHRSLRARCLVKRGPVHAERRIVSGPRRPGTGVVIGHEVEPIHLFPENTDSVALNQRAVGTGNGDGQKRPDLPFFLRKTIQSLAHRARQLDKIGRVLGSVDRVLRPAGDRILPIQIDSVQTIFSHQPGRLLREGRTGFLAGCDIRECRGEVPPADRKQAPESGTAIGEKRLERLAPAAVGEPVPLKIKKDPHRPGTGVVLRLRKGVDQMGQAGCGGFADRQPFDPPGGNICDENRRSAPGVGPVALSDGGDRRTGEDTHGREQSRQPSHPTSREEPFHQPPWPLLSGLPKGSDGREPCGRCPRRCLRTPCG